MLRYAVSPYRVWHALVRRYRDPFFVRLPETPGTVATGHPDGVKAIVSADASTLVPWRIPATEALLTSDSIFLQAGDAHRATRRLLAPLFQPARHTEHCAVMAAVVSAELDAVAPGPAVAQDLAQRLTLRIILAVLFGLSGGPRAARFQAAARRALDDSGPAFLYLRFLRRRFSRFARVIGALEDMRARVQDEIDLRRAAAPGSGASAPGATGCPFSSGAAPGAAPDMLDQLMRARRPDGSALTDREIQVHLCDLVVAGHETTTVAIAWACYELCRHPAVMARLVAELDAHPPPRDAASLARLRYLEAVCHETLRLHPPLVFLTRQVARPLTVNGHSVGPGLGVSLVLPLIHGDPAIYPDPQAFRPERFLERGFGPEQFLPFGGGAKRCLGASFALQEMMIVLAGLLSRFAIRLRRDREVRPRARAITVAPAGGVELVLERRRAEPRVTAAAAPGPCGGSCAR
ncbi:MAG TPA: cytochrome P450 [Kofleriaceae bacterium]|nr:cytochrome P450 [Kofleriaceae bacterium]